MDSKTYVIGDIHGAYKALHQLLESVPIQPKDRFIFLGDYVDGWSESPKVIEYLLKFSAHYDCVFLKGNHDDLCYRWLKDKECNDLWLFHGGQQSVDAYKKVPEETIQAHIQFFESLKIYHIDEQNRLFVHAGYTNLKGIDFEYYENMCFWDRSLWELALATPESLLKQRLIIRED